MFYIIVRYHLFIILFYLGVVLFQKGIVLELLYRLPGLEFLQVRLVHVQQRGTEAYHLQYDDGHQQAPRHIVNNRLAADGAHLVVDIVQHAELRALELVGLLLEGIVQRVDEAGLDVVFHHHVDELAIALRIAAVVGDVTDGEIDEGDGYHGQRKHTVVVDVYVA